MANTTESRDFYISSLDDDHNYRSIGDTSTVIGSGYMPSGSIMIGLVNSKNTTTYVYWHFDISAIPAGAEIESVSCGVKMSCTSNNNGARATAQLYAGTTAKGSSVTGNKGTSTSQKTITDAGTWTREELDSIMLKLWARWGTNYTKNCAIYFSGAVLTIQYTYNSEKFMLKTGGAWADAYRVFKKVNVIWVEQTDLANVIEDGVRYQNGGEYVSLNKTVTITGKGLAYSGNTVLGVVINGVTYAQPATIEVDAGTVIQVHAGEVYLNGVVVPSHGSIYSHTVNENCTINLELNFNQNSAKATITTE